MLSFSCLHDLALLAGLDEVGVSKAAPVTDGQEKYLEWLARGYHGEMSYLERNFEKRFDPTLLVPGAKSIISALLSYKLEGKGVWSSAPKVSRYAVLRDYHFILKERLYRLLELLREACGTVSGRAFVDSAPFLDRYWAMRSGLGWIGQHSLLISPRLGSFVFIGSLVVDIDIETTEHPVRNRCGNCNHCVAACPTGALLGKGLVDARKCISYLTIEKKSELTAEEGASLSGWAYGCDTCQEACPWNRHAPVTHLTNEVLISREVLNRFAEGKTPLPAESPMTRANPERLRLLLSKSCKE